VKKKRKQTEKVLAPRTELSKRKFKRTRSRRPGTDRDPEQRGGVKKKKAAVPRGGQNDVKSSKILKTL